MVVSRLTKVRFDGIVFIALRQFGTGIIISTALVHVSMLAAKLRGVPTDRF
jgi:hypothetical protein